MSATPPLTPSLYTYCGNCNVTGSRDSLTVRILSKVRYTKGAESRPSTGRLSQWQKMLKLAKGPKWLCNKRKFIAWREHPAPVGFDIQRSSMSKYQSSFQVSPNTRFAHSSKLAPLTFHEKWKFDWDNNGMKQYI